MTVASKREEKSRIKVKTLRVNPDKVGQVNRRVAFKPENEPSLFASLRFTMLRTLIVRVCEIFTVNINVDFEMMTFFFSFS